MPRIAGFRLGVYVVKDAEIVDFAAPYGVFSVARRFDPELDAFLLLRRAGYDEAFISETARVMEYAQAYDIYRGDLERGPAPASGG